jgi:tetratricopeptide (TPR) repeat protein
MKRLSTPLIALFLVLWQTPCLAANERAEALLTEGVAVYAEAQSLTDRNARIAAFNRAEQLFGEATEHGASNADVHANAGTAALQAERLGPAVLQFRRALEIDPDHERARRNLTHARTLLPAWVPTPEESSIFGDFFFWHRSLSKAERLGTAAGSFLLAALCLAVALVWRSRLARGVAVLPALVWVGLMASLALEAGEHRERSAVITADEVFARASDSANAPTRFADALPAGTEVELVETREHWSRIRLANNRDAWVNRNTVTPVR